MKVMAIGTLKPLTPEQRQRYLPAEVPATPRLYLDGKMEQFWLRDKEEGVIFLMSVDSVDEADRLLKALPLGQANLLTFDLMWTGRKEPCESLPSAGPKARPATGRLRPESINCRSFFRRPDINRSHDAVLAAVTYARYRRHLGGGWRRVYVIGAVFALYLNFLVLIMQSFQKVAPLHALAPNRNEPPFQAAQLVSMAAFIVLGTLASKNFRAKCSDSPEYVLTPGGRS